MLQNNQITEIKKIVGSNNVLLTDEEKFSYSTDAGSKMLDCVIPKAVVFVENIKSVQKLMKFANQNCISVIARGAGTNMVGACACTKDCIVIDFSKMNRVLDLDTTNLTITVEPGVIIGNMKNMAEKEGLFFPPDPSNYKVSTIGGAIAQSSGGANSFKYGTIKDYVLSLTVILADGRLVVLGGKTPKYAMGYHLEQLMVGSEGTLGIIVEATLKLIPMPSSKKVLAAYFDSINRSINAVSKIIMSNIAPSTIDFMDNLAIKTVEDFKHAGLKTSSECMLIIEVDGNENAVREDVQKITDILTDNGAEYVHAAENEQEAEAIWDARRSSFAASVRIAPDVISDDIIVPRKYLYQMIEKCIELREKYSLNMILVGHVGDGNIHPQVALNKENINEFENYMIAKHNIYDYATELGGAISAEHGIGREKCEYYRKITDKYNLELMKDIKKLFDVNNILNPGKIF